MTTNQTARTWKPYIKLAGGKFLYLLGGLDYSQAMKAAEQAALQIPEAVSIGATLEIDEAAELAFTMH